MTTIAPCSGVSFEMRKGDVLRVVDPEGGQVSDLFCFNLRDREEAFSSGRSIDAADTILLTRGHALYSNRGSPMLEIVEDSCGRHDILYTPCSHGDQEPNCSGNLFQAFARHGLASDRVGTTFNIFMNVQVGENGEVRIEPPLSKPGDFIVFKAEMDLLVGLTACSHPISNGGHCSSIQYEVLTGSML